MTWSHRQYKRAGRRQLGALLLLTLFCIAPASAQDQNAVVRSDPPVLEISTGETATLTVLLAGAQDVYGIDVRAAFDPQLVEVVDADPAREGVQFTPGAFPQPDFVARNMADNQAGSLHYAITQVNPTEPVTGSGVIFTVQFRAKASSGQSTFTIETVELTDRDGIAMGVQPESGVIRIMPEGQATTTTAPPTATASPTTAVMPIVPTSAPTDAPPPAPAGTATPAIATSTPTSPPAPIETPAPPTAVAPSPVPAVAAQMALPTDNPAGPAPALAANPAEVAAQSSTTPEQPAAQAIAAATATPASALAGAQPTAPAGNGAEPRASAVTSKSAASDQAVPDRLPRRQPSTESASVGHSTSNEPSRILLAIGIGALAAAAVTAMLLVVIIRR